MKLYINKSQYGYSTTCKDKDKNIKAYLDVQFKKGAEPTTDQIEIHNAFFSCYKNNKEEIKPKLVVMDYMDVGKDFEDGQATQEYSDLIKKTTNAIDDSAFADFGNCIELDESEIAF